jgi:hypothetical protein
MNMKKTKIVLSLIVALSTLAVGSAQAAPSEAQVAAVKQAFVKVPAPEMGAKAAQLVVQAKADEKQDIAVAVVQTVADQNPAAVPSVVAAIIKVAPQTAPAVAEAASKKAPKQAVSISVAAINAAPLYADQVTQQVSEAVPSSASRLAELNTVRERSLIRSASNDGPTITPGTITGEERDEPTPAPEPTEGSDSRRDYASP